MNEVEESELAYLRSLLEEQDTMIVRMERKIESLKDENERLKTRLFSLISDSYPS